MAESSSTLIIISLLFPKMKFDFLSAMRFFLVQVQKAKTQLVQTLSSENQDLDSILFIY